MNRGLENAWGELLSRYPWDWFLTLTFDDPVPPFRAHRQFARFARQIEEAAGIPIAWFRGDDFGRRGGRLHLHALMLNVGHLRPFPWMKKWEKRAGYARIWPYDSNRGAAYYIGKHVAGDFAEWDFSDLTALRQYQPPLISAPEGREG